jgi:hypothetical protein
MIFVQAHPQARPPVIDKIGAVQYVMWHAVKCEDKTAYFLFPNGAELKTSATSERLVAVAESPEEAWSRIMTDKPLLKKYGIPT